MADSRETKLWLLRHPEPNASVAGRCYGSLDVALSGEGIRQAHAVARALAGEKLAAIYTSPLRRCSEAARILAEARGVEAKAVSELRELHFGECEGRSYAEIAASMPELYKKWMERPTSVRFPGGESLSEMQARVIPAARELRLRHAGESIAVVTHSGTIRIMLAEAMGLDLDRMFRIGQRYGGVTLIRYFGESPVVETVNGTGR